jgi:hypothetical protein
MGRKKSVSAGLGIGPLLILLFLFVASLLAIVAGQSLFQLGVRIGIVVALVALIYVVWYQLAIRNPLFRMGTGGESVIVLFVLAIAFLFVADPVARSLQLALLPPQWSMSLMDSGSTAVAFNTADLMSGLIAVLVAVAALAVLASMVLRNRKQR